MYNMANNFWATVSKKVNLSEAQNETEAGYIGRNIKKNWLHIKMWLNDWSFDLKAFEFQMRHLILEKEERFLLVGLAVFVSHVIWISSKKLADHDQIKITL